MKFKKGFIAIVLSMMMISSANSVDALSLKATANLNMRNGASTYYKKIGVIPYGKSVEVLGSYNGWYKVKYNNTIGWSSGDYLAKSNSKNTVKKSYDYTAPRLIIVNKSNRTVSLYEYGKLTFMTSCAIGKSSTPTPSGKGYVMEKIVNRPYYKLNIPGGSPRNPLGVRWMGLSNFGNGIGIHGTNNPSSIGSAVSNGCIRVRNERVIKLYDKVRVGDTVIIGNQSNVENAKKYGFVIY